MACEGCNSASKKGCGSNVSCRVSGCKLTVFDWLSNFTVADAVQNRFVEVQFKNSRKEFFNKVDLTIQTGDVVVTHTDKGYDVGIVVLMGPLVLTQMKKKKVDLDDDFPKIYRKATDRDIEIWKASRSRELEIQEEARKKVSYHKLKMKISDVEFQGDGKKITFYYTSESRVDFRELVKDMSSSFGVRIEMRQIGLRQEASRLGGIGSCGRELCCSTWLTDFRLVTTSAARYQQLALNPQKLSGQCGKLKCCLNFELDTYMDAIADFPKRTLALFTEKGKAYCQKVDIFKKQLWYSYKNQSDKWIELSLENVENIIRKNKADKKVASLEDFESDCENIPDIVVSNLLEESINRFDKPKSRNKSNNRRKKKVNNTNTSSRRNLTKQKKDNN